MAKNFAEIAFSDAVKELQERNGSRKNYERMEKNQVKNGMVPKIVTLFCIKKAENGKSKKS